MDPIAPQIRLGGKDHVEIGGMGNVLHLRCLERDELLMLGKPQRL